MAWCFQVTPKSKGVWDRRAKLADAANLALSTRRAYYGFWSSTHDKAWVKKVAPPAVLREQYLYR
jgi:hypothetical protein